MTGEKSWSWWWC